MVKLYIRTETTKHIGNKDNELFPKYSQEAFRCPGGPILNSHGGPARNVTCSCRNRGRNSGGPLTPRACATTLQLHTDRERCASTVFVSILPRRKLASRI